MMANIKDRILGDIVDYGMECYRDGRMVGRAEALIEFQEWLRDKVDIVGFDDKTNKILVAKDGKWVSAIDAWLKEQKK